ncbi:MAG: rod shape-determining protein MreC, partial [Gammaproteobacteria bacterium]|nr:rod shape-determining protein MreC [Gammaproteobacteria bacterium]
MLQIAGFQLRAPSNLARFLVCALLAIILMYMDARGQHLHRLRAGLAMLFTPIQWIATVPTRVGGWAMDFIHGDEPLRKELERFRSEQPILLARMQKYEALEAENEHLRELLGASALVADKAMAAELLEVTSEPFRRTLIVARGEKDGLYVGQPVIDTYGIRGQVSEVGITQSKVILITDPGHAIPVQVNRNGLLAIAFGTGASDTVSIRYLTATSDIKERDLIVSSGIGGHFPFGYPVAVVTRIINNPNESFLDIEAKPVAQLAHNKEVLLIWPNRASTALAKKPAPKSPAKTTPTPATKPAVPSATSAVPKPASTAPTATAAPKPPGLAPAATQPAATPPAA